MAPSPPSSTLLLTTAVFSVLFLAILPPSSADVDPNADSSCGFKAIYNFGDSNSDTGGLGAVFGEPSWPNGMSYFNGGKGRFCDGRVILDFIAQHLGLPLINAYLDSIGTNFTHGANYATSGATIAAVNSTKRQTGYSPISLEDQWVEHSDFYRRSHDVREKLGGVFTSILPKREDFSNALYTFDIGQNDLTYAYFYNNFTTEQVKEFVPVIIDIFKQIVRNVHWLGGRSFWIHNTGPIGCLPYLLDRVTVYAAQMDQYGCATPMNEAAQFYNTKLKEAVIQLRKDLPDALISYVDVYSQKYTLLTEGQKHGFEHPLKACCGHGGKYNFNKDIWCGKQIEVDGKMILLGAPCKNPEAAVSWDGVHFTQAANKFIFEHIADGSYSDPPLPLEKACLKNLS